MKFRIVFNIEDLDHHVRKEINKTPGLENFLSNWLYYGKYVSIVFDTEKNTAEVLNTREENYN